MEDGWGCAIVAFIVVAVAVGVAHGIDGVSVETWTKLLFSAIVISAVGFLAYSITRHGGSPDPEPGEQLVRGDAQLQTPQADERARAAAVRESDRRVREAIARIAAAENPTDAEVWGIVGHLDDAEMYVLHERYKRFKGLIEATRPPGQRETPGSLREWADRHRG